MSIDIKELRRLHAATLKANRDGDLGKWIWEVDPESWAPWIAHAQAVFPALLDEIEGLTDENRMLTTQAESLAKRLTEARANDRCAMGYLAKCMEAAGYAGDYPELIDEIEQLRKLAGQAKAFKEALERQIAGRKKATDELLDEIERLRARVTDLELVEVRYDAMTGREDV